VVVDVICNEVRNAVRKVFDLFSFNISVNTSDFFRVIQTWIVGKGNKYKRQTSLQKKLQAKKLMHNEKRNLVFSGLSWVESDLGRQCWGVKKNPIQQHWSI